MKIDSQLQQDVMATLKWEPAVRAAQIGAGQFRRARCARHDETRPLNP